MKYIRFLFLHYDSINQEENLAKKKLAAYSISDDAVALRPCILL